jgi:hypothetical protein
VILASYGIYAANIMGIDAVGISGPEGHSRHTDDWGSNDGRTEPKAAAHCSVWVYEDQASHRNITYEMGPLGAWKKIADSPQVVKSLRGERCKPKPNIGAIQVVLQRVPVGGGGNIPKCPAAYLKIDLEIVPGSQQSTGISNWFQDEIIAVINRSLPEAKVRAKMPGVSYHRKLFRGQHVYIYMAHARNAMVQEVVASTLRDYKIPVVPWGVYNAAKEMGDMESGLKAFKETMAKVVGAQLSSSDRRSLGRRYLGRTQRHIDV